MNPLTETPQYLSERYRSRLDLNLSVGLREAILDIDARFESMSQKDFYTAVQGVLATYRAEKPHATNCAELQILTNLFWEVTQRTKQGEAKRKGYQVPYWNLNVFNYTIILGRAEPDVAAISWRLVDEFEQPVSSIVEIYKVVKEIVAETKRPTLLVYTQVIQLTKDFDTTGKEGLNSIWSEGVQNRIRAEFGLGPLVAKGQRKKKNPSPSCQPKLTRCRGVRSQTAISSDVTAIPEMAGPKLVPQTKKQSVPSPVEPPETPSNEARQLMTSIREHLNVLIEMRVGDLSEDNRAKVRTLMQHMQGEVFTSLRSMVRHLTQQEVAFKSVQASTQELLARRAYEEAVAYFGITLPRGGLVSLGSIKPLWKQMSRDYHPDLNPGLEATMQVKFDELQKAYTIIVVYNHNHNHNHNHGESNGLSGIESRAQG